MPTYQYACTACDHRFEAVQSFSDPALTVCPECEGRLRKVYSGVGVVFKGSGFYRTDSRSSGPGGGAKSGGDGGATGSSSGGDSGASGSAGSGGTSGSGTSGSGSGSSGSGSSGSGSSGSGSSGTKSSGKSSATSAA